MPNLEAEPNLATSCSCQEEYARGVHLAPIAEDLLDQVREEPVIVPLGNPHEVLVLVLPKEPLDGRASVLAFHDQVACFVHKDVQALAVAVGFPAFPFLTRFSFFGLNCPPPFAICPSLEPLDLT